MPTDTNDVKTAQSDTQTPVAVVAPTAGDTPADGKDEPSKSAEEGKEKTTQGTDIESKPAVEEQVAKAGSADIGDSSASKTESVKVSESK